MGSLKNKKAIITGAEQGIGKATAEELLKAGCDIAIHYFEGDEGPKELVELANSLGRRAFYYQADLTKSDEVKDFIAKSADFLGSFDVLINNVGGLIARKYLQDIDDDFWHKVIDVNLTTMMYVTKEALPHLEKAEHGASIVNLASLAGRKGGHPGSLVYSSMKGAVLTWTRALSNELATSGIRVNAVAPGLILGTRFHNEHTTKESADETIKGIPLGRAGNVYDIARPICYLASEYDGFITGVTLDINGGVYCA